MTHSWQELVDVSEHRHGCVQFPITLTENLEPVIETQEMQNIQCFNATAMHLERQADNVDVLGEPGVNWGCTGG